MFLVKTLEHHFGLGSFLFLLMRGQVLAPGLPRPALRGPTAAKCLDPFNQKGTSIEMFLVKSLKHDFGLGCIRPKRARLRESRG